MKILKRTLLGTLVLVGVVGGCFGGVFGAVWLALNHTLIFAAAILLVCGYGVGELLIK